MIPKNIKRHHVIEAIREIDSAGIPQRRKPTGYTLLFEGKKYPPKLVLSLANRFANGKELASTDFSGGSETNNFLRKMGFEIVELSKDMQKEIRPHIDTIYKTKIKSHDERCLKCKEKIKKFLEIIFGEVKQNYRFYVGTATEDFKNTPYYESLLEIYNALQDYRGFKDFVKVRNLPNCDFFIPDHGFIVEFDESQHFTLPRVITLKKYPQKLSLGFERNDWIRMCFELDRKDDNPPYRDEQRAWYDTLRDFYSNILGISIIRLYPKEHVWCSLNEDDENDVAWFKNFIQNKMVSSSGKGEKATEGKALKIGLAFPELEKHDVHHFLRILGNASIKLDLLVFPEAFEFIEKEDKTDPEDIIKQKNFKELADRYHEISKKFDVCIIVGVSVDYEDSSISGGGNDQYCLFVSPDGRRALYHKHSSSKYTAFFDNEWSIDKNFPVLEVANEKVGLSICHDSYISLIPRILKTKGADIWVNISFQNVRSHVWEAVLQTRAIENGIISICTLHRNSKKGEGRPQKEPYAFSEKGKIRLRELVGNNYIDLINPEKRAGRIYYFNTLGFETYSVENIEETDLPEKADTISIIKAYGDDFKIEGRNAEFAIEHMSIKEFVFSPEKIWQLSLKKKDKTTFIVVWVKDKGEWAEFQKKVEKIIKGRIIEFSTFFIFMDKEKDNLLMAAYRSSNYKDSRIFYPQRFPLIIDKRYLKGMKSIYEISLDGRKKSDAIYFQKINQMIQFLQLPAQ